MLLLDAKKFIESYVGKEIPVDENVKNKGRFGHALEKFIGLKLGSHALDFEDGELKTCALRNGKMKEDFKICKVWDKEYIESKLANMLLVLYDYDTRKIVSVQQLSILDHPIIRSQFDKDLDILLNHPNFSEVTQSDTDVFVAKTNDTGNKAINSRALYIARAPWGYITGCGYTKASIKGKKFVEEMETYEQTKTGCAA